MSGNKRISLVKIKDGYLLPLFIPTVIIIIIPARGIVPSDSQMSMVRSSMSYSMIYKHRNSANKTIEPSIATNYTYLIVCHSEGGWAEQGYQPEDVFGRIAEEDLKEVGQRHEQRDESAKASRRLKPNMINP